jgi:hypothetical protein
MTTDLGKDINATIVAAVNAKVTAEVFAALNSDEVFGQFVSQAMMEPIQPDRYSSKREPYITNVIRTAIQKATREAINEWMKDNEGVVKSKVRDALALRMEDLAGALVEGAIEATGSNYSTKVDVKFQKEARD